MSPFAAAFSLRFSARLPSNKGIAPLVIVTELDWAAQEAERGMRIIVLKGD